MLLLLLLLLLLLVCLIFWFVGSLFMICALLKFELSGIVISSADFFTMNSQADSVMLFILVCLLSFCNV